MFKFAGIDWRLDTLINTAAMILTFILCTSAIVRTLRTDIRVEQEGIISIQSLANSLQIETHNAGNILSTVSIFQNEHKGLSRQIQANFEEIKRLESQVASQQKKENNQ